jgi:hypothetical protein
MPPKVPGYGRASAAKTRSAVGGWTERHAGQRAAPKSAPAQTRFVLRDRYDGSTKRMADDYGVSQRTVQRWLKGERSPGRSAPGRRVSRDVSDIRERRAVRHAKAAVRRGQVPRVRIKGEIGPDVPQGRDYRRRRTITRDLSRDDALDMLDAYGRGDDAAVHDVIERAYGGYFDRGMPGGQAAADIGQIDWIELG